MHELTIHQETIDVSVVIPCYNECENIPLLAARVNAVFEQLPRQRYECIFVDDGSTDQTPAVIARTAAEYPAVRPLRMARNSGQSAALVAGLRAARGRYILTLDGDLQNDPADMPDFLKLLESYHCVCGYRAKRNDTWIRRFSSKVANRVRNWILKDGIRDSGCGAKGFRREVASYIVPFNGVHRFLAVFVRNAGFTIAEMPVAHHARQFGVSKYGIGNRLWRGIYDLFGVAWLRARYVHPLVDGGTAHPATAPEPAFKTFEHPSAAGNRT